MELIKKRVMLVLMRWSVAGITQQRSGHISVATKSLQTVLLAFIGLGNELPVPASKYSLLPVSSSCTTIKYV
jgi:hypothetical protein